MSKKFHNFVLGCQMNASDAERIASIYRSMGFTEALNEDDADIITVVSCAIRQSSMDRIYGRLQKWKQLKMRRPLLTVLTGCVLPADQEKLSPEFDIFFNIKTLSNLPQLISEKFEDQKFDLPRIEYFSVTPHYESSYKAYVPIMTGCNKFCTYCAVPYTRGPEVSRPYQDIIHEVTHLLARGYKEITLIGQNVNSYANDLPNQPEKFPQLLSAINSLPGDFWLRFTTSHPYDMSDELIKVMTEGNHLCEYFHLPVQSGNDMVLKKMNRHYTVAHYKERINTLKQTLPNIAVSTDIIVGFPFETEEAFQDTVTLFKECEFDMAYLSRYSERPGTTASKAFEDTISDDEKARRETILNDILKQNGLKYNAQFIGKTTRVLVDKTRPSKETLGLFQNTGKNRENKTVIFEAGREYTGQFVDVKITEIDTFALHGELATTLL